MRTLAPWFRKSLPIQRREEELPLYSLQREINSLFNDFFRGFEVTPWNVGTEEVFGDYAPRVDMHETEKEITISVELPGMEEKDVNITLAKDVLTISGEKKSEKTEDAKGHYRMERIYGSFRRSIGLPAEVDSNRCEASFKNGVLTVTLAKTAESQKTAKTIPIKKA